MPNPAQAFVAVGFLAVIGTASVIQTAAELRQGERPQALDLFHQAPTEKNLREFESELQDRSLVAKRLRPWAQYARFQWLGDAGEKAVIGRHDWLFYRPGLDYITQRPAAPLLPGGPNDALLAITSFRDQLAARGIRLLVVPAPNKESVYPEMLSHRAEGAGVIICRQTRELLDQLRSSGVEVLDLFEEFGRAKQAQAPTEKHPFYLAHDSHWSPEGMELAVQATARHMLQRGWISRASAEYDVRTIESRRLGDVLEMLQVPQLDRAIGPEIVTCGRVVRHGTSVPYQDASDAQVLVLGDSFLRIYQQDSPGAAGFVAHLARELKQPLTSIVGDGGASTLVRQDLSRRSNLLKNKRVVIWEFVERDIRYGTEGWQVVPLPPDVP
jgi:hypothetical protein